MKTRAYASGAMLLARQISRVVLAVALGTYAFDCQAQTTPAHAMQCCAAMRCMRDGRQSPHQAMGCCKVMNRLHSPFILPSLSPGITHSADLVAVLPAMGGWEGFTFSPRRVAARSHAPPVFSPASPSPLRI